MGWVLMTFFLIFSCVFAFVVIANEKPLDF